MKNNIKNSGLVFEISTSKGYGYCQHVNFGKDIFNHLGMLSNSYEGTDILAIFPGIFKNKLQGHEIHDLIMKQPLDHRIVVLPKRKFPEDMQKLKVFPIAEKNKEMPIMKDFFETDQNTGKATHWIVYKDFSSVLFNGEILPQKYLNAPTIFISSIGGIINIIEKQNQPKDSVFVKGRK